MVAPEKMTDREAGWVMATLATVIAAVGYLGLNSLMPQCDEPTRTSPVRFATPVLSPRGSQGSQLHVCAMSDLSRYRESVHTASVSQPDPKAENSLQAIEILVREFRTQLERVDESLTQEVGIGLGDVMSEIQRQVALAVVGAGATESTENLPAVVFAIDARGRIEQARTALTELLQSVQNAETSTSVDEYAIRGHEVCSVTQGDDRVLFTWLGRVLVGSLAPEALEAAIVAYLANYTEKSFI